MKNTLIISEEYEGVRIDRYIASQIDDISRTAIQKLLLDNNIIVNDKPCKSNYKLRANDVIKIDIPELKDPKILPENIELSILYEDNDIILIDKPKGMVVHPAPGHYSGTLVNALLFHCKDNLSTINGLLRPGIVHRIDMNTTGVLVACKNDFAHTFITNQLKEHSIQRKYQAIVHNIVKNDYGTINEPIGRNPRDRKKMAIDYKNGKDAITDYRVLERFNKHSYIECELHTGRTHQIRVHMSSINHPILGDDVYGPNYKNIHKLTGQTLHAKALGLIHPRTKEFMEFEAPLPEYFQKLLKKLN